MQGALASGGAWPRAAAAQRTLRLLGSGLVVTSRIGASSCHGVPCVSMTSGKTIRPRSARTSAFTASEEAWPQSPLTKVILRGTFLSGLSGYCCPASFLPQSQYPPRRRLSATRGSGGFPAVAGSCSPSSSSSSISRVSPPSSPVSAHLSLPVSSKRLRSLFARADILAHLLQSRLALPLLYPLNSGGALTNRLASSPAVDSAETGLRGESLSENNPIASSRWRKSEVLMGLGTVTPMVLAATSISRFLKAAHALSHFGATKDGQFVRGGVGGPRGRLEKTALGRSRTHFLRPQVWRVLKPGAEQRTKHLKWR